MNTTPIRENARPGRIDLSPRWRADRPLDPSPARPSDHPGHRDGSRRELADIARSVIAYHLGRPMDGAKRHDLPGEIERRLIDAVTCEINRRRGGNHVVNRLEAEAIVYTILEQDCEHNQATRVR